MSIVFSLDRKKKFLLILQWILISIVGGEILAGMVFGGEIALFLEFLKWEVILIFLWTFFSCNLLEISYYHPYRIFLITFFVFLLGRVFLDVLGVINFADDVFFIQGLKFSNSTQFLMLGLTALFLLFLHLGAICGNLTKKTTPSIWNYDPVMEKVGTFLFYFFLLPAIFYWYQFIQFVLENGYRGLSSDSVIISSNIIIKLSDDLLMIGYFLLLASKTSFKALKWPTLIYILVLACTLVTGRRIFFFTQLLTIMTYYGLRGKISKKIFLIGGICMAIIAVVVGIYRSVSEFGNIGDYNFAVNFFADQGISIHSLGLTIDYIKEGSLSYDIRYLIQPLENIIGVSSSGYNESQVINSDFFLADRLSFLFDQDLYTTGGGLGSSIIAEFYIIGGIAGIICGSFLFGIGMILIPKILFRSNFGMVVLLIMLPMLLFTPRAHPLLAISELVKPLFLVVLSLIVYYFLLINSRQTTR